MRSTSQAEVRCHDGELEGATLSDNGYVIISRFFEASGLNENGIVPNSMQPLLDPTPGRLSQGKFTFGAF